MDDFARHELLDRLSLAAGLLEVWFSDHPALDEVPSIRDHVAKALDELGDAYQEAGRAFL